MSLVVVVVLIMVVCGGLQINPCGGLLLMAAFFIHLHIVHLFNCFWWTTFIGKISSSHAIIIILVVNTVVFNIEPIAKQPPLLSLIIDKLSWHRTQCHLVEFEEDATRLVQLSIDKWKFPKRIESNSMLLLLYVV